MKQISQNIRRLRKEKGMSQEQLAQALHVTRQTVSAWERGIAQPGLDVLGQIAQLLGVEPERLLYGEDSGKQLRKSHENPSLKKLYDEFLGEPCGHKSHELLHTHYVKRGL